MNLIDQIESQQIKKDLPDIHVGDTVKVHIKIVEGQKERTQIFEGVVIGMRGGGIRRTLTVRKISFGIGVERVLPIHSPIVGKIEIVKRAKVRRAKLYYLRKLSGKAARLKELRKPGKKQTKAKSKSPAKS